MPLNIFKKKKEDNGRKKGVNIEEPYFAMIVPGSFDKDEGVVHDLIESIPNLEQHWPSATLRELQFFTEGLHELARATNVTYNIESVQYMRPGEKKQPVFTGLTWDNASIGPSFTNYVVQTVENTLNDEGTRDDDNVDYTDTIVPALTTFMDSALALSDVDSSDLPELPSDVEYEKAVQTNTQLYLEPKKYASFNPVDSVSDTSIGTGSVNNMTETENAVDSTPEAPQLEEPVPDFNFGLGVTSTPEPAVQMETSEPTMVATSPEPPKQKPVQPAVAEKPVKQVIVDDPIDSFVSRLQVTPPLFKVTDESNKLANPADDDYVATKLNEERLEANAFLTTTANQLENAIKSNCLNNGFIREQQLKLEADSDELLNSDWEKDVHAGIEQGINVKFEQQLAESEQALTKGYEDAVAQEVSRHEAMLQTLQADHDRNLIEASNRIDSLRVNELATAKEAALPAVQAKMDAQLAQLRNRFTTDVQRHVETKSYDLLSQANELLTDLFADFEKNFSEREKELLPIHQDALTAALAIRKADSSIDTADSLKVANSELLKAQTNSEQRLIKLTTELNAAKQAIADKDQDNEKSLAEFNRIQGELNALRRENDSKSNNDFLTAALINQNQANDQKSKQGWNKMTIVAFTALALLAGGGGYAMYHQNERQVAFNQSMEKKQNDLMAQVSAEKEKAASEEKRADKLEQDNKKLHAEQSAPTEKSFADLDADLNRGSLTVYFDKYYGEDLKTENRTLKVGKLLIQYDQLATAQEVARVNKGHNWQLVQQLSGV